MKNVVLCFDHVPGQPGSRDATNAEALFHLLENTDGQIVWSPSGARASPPTRGGRLAALRWRKVAIEDARATVAEAYKFLVDRWQQGDRIFMFAGGRDACCARELTRLLGTIGIPPNRSDDLLDYELATYVLPRTRRTPQDWQRVQRLAARLAGRREIVVPVWFLGLWDTVKVPGLPRSLTAEPLTNVLAGRHAVAIDGGPFRVQLMAHAPDRIEEVWFRGAHNDIAGGPEACWPLTDIALDWILDGAVDAGAIAQDGKNHTAPIPSDFDALAGSTPIVSLRKLPIDALVHASVDIYLRAHPQYWRRLPARIEWTDIDWLARSERLAPATKPSVPSAAPVKSEGLIAAVS